MTEPGLAWKQSMRDASEKKARAARRRDALAEAGQRELASIARQQADLKAEFLRRDTERQK